MTFTPNKLLKWYAILLTGILMIFIFSSYSKKEAPVGPPKAVVEDGSLPQIIKSIDMERRYDFAGEELPMKNFDVKERLERELLVNSYWHSSTVLNIKNAHRYLPVISRILRENGIPEDFKYLAIAESNLRNETSPAGAKGFWQFMKPTAKYYGLEINSEVDQRFHVELATQAACKYIQDYYKRFGSWTLAAAAYNVGGTKLNRALQDQKVDNYYDLNLNAETNRYVFRIMAMKEIISNPDDFGFYIPKDEQYQTLDEYKIVEVDGPIQNLGDFAKKQGTSYRMLKLYNPWLMTHQLINSARKTYQIKIPY